MAGVVRMSDVLITGKAQADNAAMAAAVELEEFKRVYTERDHLFRENQRLLLEIRDLSKRCDPLVTSPAP